MIVARSSGSPSCSRCGEVGRFGGEQVGVTNQIAGRRVGRLDDHRRLERAEPVADGVEASQEGVVLEDRHLGATVVDQVVDLIGSRRVVDRDGCRPAEQHRQVDGVELGPVRQHQHDTVTLPDPEPAQARRQTGDVVGDLGQRLSLPVAVGALPTQHLDIAMTFEIGEESLRHGLAGDRLVEFL